MCNPKKTLSLSNYEVFNTQVLEQLLSTLTEFMNL